MLYKGLYDGSSSLSLPVFNKGFATAYFSESGNKPDENKLFFISVSIAVIGSEIYSELILHMLNGSFAQMVLFTVRTRQRTSSWFFSEKVMRRKTGQSGIS